MVDNGFVGMNHVNRLVIAGWINKVLNLKYGVIPSNEQYAILDRLYQCVEGDCLVHYRKYCNDITVNKMEIPHYVRVMERESSIKILEETENNIRTI
jgi:hypothetical protein